MTDLAPRALLACISEARPPRPEETEEAAARIWRELFGAADGERWSQVPVGSPEHRRTIAVLRAAFGIAPVGLAA